MYIQAMCEDCELASQKLNQPRDFPMAGAGQDRDDALSRSVRHTSIYDSATTSWSEDLDCKCFIGCFETKEELWSGPQQATDGRWRR